MLCCLVFVCVEVESSSPNESAGSPDALPTSRFFFSSSLFSSPSSRLIHAQHCHPCLIWPMNTGIFRIKYIPLHTHFTPVYIIVASLTSTLCRSSGPPAKDSLPGRCPPRELSTLTTSLSVQSLVSAALQPRYIFRLLEYIPTSCQPSGHTARAKL